MSGKLLLPVQETLETKGKEGYKEQFLPFP